MHCYFAMSHGSYNLNLGLEILILAGDIRSRSWLNIGDSYSNIFLKMSFTIITYLGQTELFRMFFLDIMKKSNYKVSKLSFSVLHPFLNVMLDFLLFPPSL